MKLNIITGLLFSLLFMSACSHKTLSTSKEHLPQLQNNKKTTITLFALHNYTDTPRAGKRAANIVEGLLASKGYSVNYIEKALPFEKELSLAQQNSSDYFMSGAVSEWRYKTGIDGEPAVSLRLALYDANTGKLVWSGIGANNDWGRGSIGTTAQSLIEEMLN